MGLFGPPKKSMKEPISSEKKPKIHQSSYDKKVLFSVGSDFKFCKYF